MVFWKSGIVHVYYSQEVKISDYESLRGLGA